MTDNGQNNKRFQPQTILSKSFKIRRFIRVNSIQPHTILVIPCITSPAIVDLVALISIGTTGGELKVNAASSMHSDRVLVLDMYFVLMPLTCVSSRQLHFNLTDLLHMKIKKHVPSSPIVFYPHSTLKDSFSFLFFFN